MISKILAFAGVVAFISTILFYIYKEGEEKGKIQEIKQNQEIEIKTKDEIIEDTKRTIKHKQIDRIVPTNKNLNWVHKNACEDCEDRQLL